MKNKYKRTIKDLKNWNDVDIVLPKKGEYVLGVSLHTFENSIWRWGDINIYKFNGKVFQEGTADCSLSHWHKIPNLPKLLKINRSNKCLSNKTV